MNREQLVRALRKYCRKRGIRFEIDERKGKGSHYVVTVGDKTSTLQASLKPGKIERFLKQVAINPADL